MAGPKPIPAPGTISRTAVARTWAAECRRSPRASGSRAVRIRISDVVLDGVEEVHDLSVDLRPQGRLRQPRADGGRHVPGVGPRRELQDRAVGQGHLDRFVQP